MAHKITSVINLIIFSKPGFYYLKKKKRFLNLVLLIQTTSKMWNSMAWISQTSAGSCFPNWVDPVWIIRAGSTSKGTFLAHFAVKKYCSILYWCSLAKRDRVQSLWLFGTILWCILIKCCICHYFCHWSNLCRCYN